MNRRALEKNLKLFRLHIAQIVISAREYRKALQTIGRVENHLFQNSRMKRAADRALAEWGKQIQRDEIIEAICPRIRFKKMP